MAIEPMSETELYGDEGPPIAVEAESSIPTAEDVGEEVPEEAADQPAEEPKPGAWTLRKAAINQVDDVAALRDQLIRAEHGIVRTNRERDDLRREVTQLRELVAPLAQALEARKAELTGEADDEVDPNDPVGRIERRFDKIEAKIEAGGKAAADRKKAEALVAAEVRQNVEAIRAFLPELSEARGITDENEAFQLYQTVTQGWATETRAAIQRLYPRAGQADVERVLLARVKEVTDLADSRGMSRAKALFLEALDDMQGGAPLNGKKAPSPARAKVAKVRQRTEETRDPLAGGGSAGRPLKASDLDNMPMHEYKKLIEQHGGGSEGYRNLMQKLGVLKTA